MPLGGAARSRASLVAAQAMPAIAEDDSVAPDVPKRSASRRTTKPITPAAVYNYNYNYAPFSSRSPTNSTTPTASSSDGTVPDRKPENNNSEAIRREERLARRRRWHCILMIAFLLIAVIVGLSVGLTLGLRKKNTSSDTAPASLSNLFPAGNYTLTTALSSISTSCSSNPKAWRCYPYALYSPSSNASSATFFWTITPKTSWSYTISSTPNPFAPSFSNLPLTLQDANQYTERLAFNFSLSQSSIVDGPLVTNDPSTTTCWFNSTIMAFTLWTRIKADFPAGIGNVNVSPSGTGGNGAFATWPYRVEVSQTQQGGEGVPDCKDAKGEEVGGSLGAEGECGCFYRNFELGSATGGNGTANATASGTGGASSRRSATSTASGASGKE